HEVTDYVREEWNRADALQDDKRKGTVGFALTILQRRLASSPAAIAESLRRRRERLERQLADVELQRRGAGLPCMHGGGRLDADDLEDLEDAPEDEIESVEEEVLDQATAARTIEELKAEISTLSRLQDLANSIRRSGEDTKWQELRGLVTQIFTPASIADRLAENGGTDFESDTASLGSPNQKLVIFTEHRDTLEYLTNRISTLLGQ